MTDQLIHPTAIISSKAQIGSSVQIGPYVIIEENTIIGDHCEIAAHAIVGPHTILGQNNKLHHHAVVGTDSQDNKFQGELSQLQVGDNNIFREFCTINRATGQGSSTQIGNHNSFLAYVHVAHNSQIGNNIVIANAAQVGGECQIEDHAIIGGLVGIHQFCRIGRHAIIGSNSKVNQDIAPYVTADGHPARPRGINRIGLQRYEFPEKTITAIRKAYKILFHKNHSQEQALKILQQEYPDSAEIAHLIQFIENSKRNIARPALNKIQI